MGGAASRIEAAAAKGLTKFVGRENSMAALMEAFNKVKNGAGQVVELVGEAEACMLKGLEILEDLETMPQWAVGCFGLCELYLNGGRIEKGLEALRKSELMFSQMKMDHWAEKARAVLARVQ